MSHSDHPLNRELDALTPSAEPVATVSPEIRGQILDLLKAGPHVLKIESLAKALQLEPSDITLPNGRTVRQIQWKPEHLPSVFTLVDQIRHDSGLGKNDVVDIDGVCPTWLLPVISHAWHPVATAVQYPQGGPGARLPISGTRTEGVGAGKDLSFKVEARGGHTLVEFSLTAPQIDAIATLQSLVAPEVPQGIPVRVTGRGPIALAAALGEAYAHRVPYVAHFQPGIGFVVSISHDSAHPIGKILS